MSLPNFVGGKKTARTEVLFIVEEGSKGALTYPAATDALALIGDPTFDQMIAKFLSLERKNFLSEFDQFATRYPAGKGDFEIYIRPNGALGVAPSGRLALKGLFGREDVVPDTSVTYLPLRVSDGLPTTQSIFLKIGDLVLQHSGFIYQQGNFVCDPGPVAASEVSGKFSGEFFCQHIAGVAQLTADQVGGDSTITVDDATQFLNTPFIRITGTNGTIKVDHVRIASIDYNTNIITVVGTLGAAVTTNDVVSGAIPDATYSGNLVNWNYGGVATEDSDPIYITKAEIQYTNGYKVIDDEKNDLPYPSDFMIASKREVVLNNVSYYFDAPVLTPHFYRAQSLDERVYEIPFGDLEDNDGNTGRFILPRVSLKTSPKVASAGGNELTMTEQAQAFMVTGDDEISLEFAV